MRNPLLWADEALITHVAEPIAWRAQYHKGWTNFTLARLANDGSSATMFVANAAIALPAMDLLTLVLGTFVTWHIWSGNNGLIKQGIRTAQKTPEAMNPRRTGLIQPLRITLYWFLWPGLTTLLAFSIGNLTAFLLATLFSVGQFAFAYFEACNPLPPKWEPKMEEAAAPNALPQST